MAQAKTAYHVYDSFFGVVVLFEFLIVVSS